MIGHGSRGLRPGRASNDVLVEVGMAVLVLVYIHLKFFLEIVFLVYINHGSYFEVCAHASI